MTSAIWRADPDRAAVAPLGPPEARNNVLAGPQGDACFPQADMDDFPARGSTYCQKSDENADQRDRLGGRRTQRCRDGAIFL